MNVYVETNFVLEIAFMQEQHESCETLLDVCGAGTARLVIPAFCIAESFETLIRRSNKRKQIANELATELRQLSRSKPYRDEIDALASVSDLLARTSGDEDQRLAAVLERLLKLADVVPLEALIVSAAAQYRVEYELAPQDSIVYASVRSHLDASRGTESCFINRNSRDFNDPDMEESLTNLGCKLLFNFEDGCNYIQHRIKSQSPPDAPS
jgi:predicted nucleic acid-binding protein